MRLGEGWLEFDGSAVRPMAAHGGDGNSFLARRRAHRDPVAHRETTSADGDPGRAGARIRCEIRLSRYGAHTRHRHGFDSMSHTVDVQPYLVANGDTGERRHLEV